MDQYQYEVAVVGAGPAGLFAARELAAAGARIAVLNRDLKPGGLAEYGIYPNKYKMKDGLRHQFWKILDLEAIEYYGHVQVGRQGDLQLEDLCRLGFQAVLVSVGAQGTKWLGLPGEELCGVYHAKDVVYFYNRLPPQSEREFAIGRRVAVVGVGNVMTDVACWLIHERQVDEVIAVARRGPAEIKFDKKEMERIIANLDRAALDAEMARVAPAMEGIGQSPEAARAQILAALPHAEPTRAPTRFSFQFCASPAGIESDGHGNIAALELDDNTLARANGEVRAKQVGTRRQLPVDTVIFAIGDRVDEAFGLPVRAGEFVKSPRPQFPVEGISYEAFDPETNRPVPGVFLAGWARQASTGLVGVARKDGANGAKALLQYLATQPAAERVPDLAGWLRQAGKMPVGKGEVRRLMAAEQAEAKRRGVVEWKYPTDEQMLAAIAGATA